MMNRTLPIIEPFRIVSLEPIAFTSGEEREHSLVRPGTNLFGPTLARVT